MDAGRCILTGHLPAIDPPGLAAFARVMAEFARVHLSPDQVMTVTMDAGVMTLRLAGDGARLRLEARDEAAAQNLRDTLGYLLDSAVEGLSEGLQWTDRAEGALPPNFRQARVAAVTQISPGFFRLRLQSEDIGFMARTGLHLRLLQPEDPSRPDWPRLSATGRTIWPAPGKLHKPVYTIRAIDPKAGWIDLDIFHHGRGRTCAWARQARKGDAVGISGPGGGWLPAARQLVLGGDETALPVIARILAEAPPDTTGIAMIALADPADRQDLVRPAGVGLEWLDPPGEASAFDAFRAAALSRLARPEPVAVLFGGERRTAARLRSDLGRRPAQVQRQIAIAAYWSDQPAAD